MKRKKSVKDVVEKIAALYSGEAKKNNNRTYSVNGTVEVGDDGYLEICLMDIEGGNQVLHLHRHSMSLAGKASWECWVFETERKVRRHHFMDEKEAAR